MCVPAWLHVCLAAWLSVCLSICLSVCLFVCLYVLSKRCALDCVLPAYYDTGFLFLAGSAAGASLNRENAMDHTFLP